MSIPIENIYYLLCYAWNKLDEKDRVKVELDSNTELLDLFAKIIINASKIILKRGIEKSYIDHTEDYSGIKGKLNATQTMKRNLLLKLKTECCYDDLSSDILSNRIILSTIYKLIKTKGLDRILKKELVAIKRMFSGVNYIELKSSHFKQIRLHRNNHFYEFLLNVCWIVYESTLPSEEQGVYYFSDFTRDEKKMNQLFEAFIRNFYRIEQSVYSSVKKESIYWQFEIENTESMDYLPKMETDITLESNERKIIIDAKYYSKTMTVNFEKERIHSSNLYQLFSYLLNQQTNEAKTLDATGILLYPTINEEYNLSYRYNDHQVKIQTVNLNTDWRNIEERLLNIIEVNNA